MGKSSFQVHHILGTLVFLVVLLFSMTLMPSGSAYWTESLVGKGEIFTRPETVTPPPFRPTLTPTLSAGTLPAVRGTSLPPVTVVSTSTATLPAPTDTPTQVSQVTALATDTISPPTATIEATSESVLIDPTATEPGEVDQTPAPTLAETSTPIPTIEPTLPVASEAPGWTATPSP